MMGGRYDDERDSLDPEDLSPMMPRVNRKRGSDSFSAVKPPEILPYDLSDGSISRLEALEDIRKLDREARSVMEGWLDAPIRLGSLLRTPSLAWKNYGIEVTDGNADELEALANSYYIQDAEEGRDRKSQGDALHRIKKRMASSQLDDMSVHIAITVRNMMKGMDDGKREFHVCDIAAGTGRVATAIVMALQGESRNLLDRVVFHLVDYTDKLTAGGKRLESYGANALLHPFNDETFLRQNADPFDFVVMAGHLHRKPMVDRYLRRINSALSQEGFFITADWHSKTAQHPKYLYFLMNALGLPESRLERFDLVFKPYDSREFERELTREERRAILDHIAYWVDLKDALARRHYNGDLRVRVTGAFLSTAQLDDELDKAGFETDISRIKQAFPKAQLPIRNPNPIRGKQTIAVTSAMRKG